MAERIRVCPLSYQTYCAVSGVESSILLAAFGCALGVSVRLKLFLYGGVLWILFAKRGKIGCSYYCEMEQVR